VTPYEGQAHAGWDADAVIDAPLRLHACQVVPEWTDYNDHMTESAYLMVVGDNSDAFFRYFGVDDSYRAAGHSLYTVETHLRNLLEAAVGEGLWLTLWVLGVGEKRVHIAHEMYRVSDGGLIASAEQMLVHVDMAAGRSCPLPTVLRGRLEAIAERHAQEPRPDWIGRAIGL
jgi:acyl-CoA thioesterase FadM